MNIGDIICAALIISFLLIRWIFYGTIPMFYNLLTVSLIILIGSLYFFVYDIGLDNRINKTQITNLLETTFQDVKSINPALTIQNHDMSEELIEKDKKDKENNENLLKYCLITGFCSLAILTFILFKIDKKFKSNYKLNLIGIIILYIIELYFSYAVIEDFKGQGLDETRNLIIKDLINS